MAENKVFWETLSALSLLLPENVSIYPTKTYTYHMDLILAPAEGMWLLATYGAHWRTLWALKVG